MTKSEKQKCKSSKNFEKFHNIIKDYFIINFEMKI